MNRARLLAPLLLLLPLLLAPAPRVTSVQPRHDEPPAYAAAEPHEVVRPLRASRSGRTAPPPPRRVVPRQVPPPKPKVVKAAPALGVSGVKRVAYRMVVARGWGAAEFTCLDVLWGARESGWNHRAGTPHGAYGIPQAKPGTKMASAGRDWLTNPVTQVRWGLGYIAGRYGTPCSALGHSYRRGWY